MVNRLEQVIFFRQPFNSSRMNLHTRATGTSRDLVVFVHGLNGSGYGTWQKFPGFLFNGDAGSHLDVAIYDYATLARHPREGWATLDFCVRQLVDGIRELEGEYSSIFLMGHSLGGVLAEEAAKAYLQAFAMRQSLRVTPLAGIVLIAAPRAGSGWALPPLGGIISEFRWLRRMSSRNEDRDRFFSSHVQSHNTATIEQGYFLMPRYACVAGKDRFVKPFSASFSIPDTQRRYLSESHTTVVKPERADDEQVTWVLKIIADVNDVRQQWHRDQQHAATRPPLPSLAPDPIVVTEFSGDFGGLVWEEIYNQVRESASTADLTVHDRRLAPDSPVDLLFAVSDAQAVLLPESPEKPKVMKAYSCREANEKLTVGISPVGEQCLTAKVLVQDWLKEEPFLSSIYVDEAADTEALRAVMSRWLQVVINRDPRRNASTSSRVERLLKGDPDPYELRTHWGDS